MKQSTASQSAFSLLLKPAKALVAALFLALVASLVSAPLGVSDQAEAGYSKKSAKKYRKAYRKKKYSSRKYRRKARRSYKRNRGKNRYSKYGKRKKRYSYRKSKKSKKYAKRYRSAKRYKYKARKKRVASLKPFYAKPKVRKSLSGGGVRWVASAGCLNGSLKSVIYQVAANYGSVTVSSTCRSKKRNRRAGGARRSKHLTGNAVDFRVRGNYRAVYAFLKSHGSVGGYKHYGGGLFHIDTGPRRTW
jgi:uncharacterized protein YcbK (DUF882 family)